MEKETIMSPLTNSKISQSIAKKSVVYKKFNPNQKKELLAYS